jgi:hypothetical protein
MKATFAKLGFCAFLRHFRCTMCVCQVLCKESRNLFNYKRLRRRLRFSMRAMNPMDTLIAHVPGDGILASSTRQSPNIVRAFYHSDTAAVVIPTLPRGLKLIWQPWMAILDSDTKGGALAWEVARFELMQVVRFVDIATRRVTSQLAPSLGKLLL